MQLYTDIIYFAPLASSFDGSGALSSATRHTRSGSASLTGVEPHTRREWIAAWLEERGIAEDDMSSSDVQPAFVPRPVSAKAVYRLADRLDLPALRLRAFQHICGQLTAQNIPAEVFSRFSSTFEDVRKVCDRVPLQLTDFRSKWPSSSNIGARSRSRKQCRTSGNRSAMESMLASRKVSAGDFIALSRWRDNLTHSMATHRRSARFPSLIGGNCGRYTWTVACGLSLRGI